jgi:hypothetical protein
MYAASRVRDRRPREQHHRQMVVADLRFAARAKALLVFLAR